MNNSGLDGRGLSVCWNPDCRCRRLLPKSRRLPFSGFLPLDVSSPAVGDIFKSGLCRCVRCRGSQSSFSNLSITSPTSQFILQPFHRFTFITVHSPTLPLLQLSHSSLIFIEQFWARWPWSIGVLES